MAESNKPILDASSESGREAERYRNALWITRISLVFWALAFIAGMVLRLTGRRLLPAGMVTIVTMSVISLAAWLLVARSQKSGGKSLTAGIMLLLSAFIAAELLVPFFSAGLSIPVMVMAVVICASVGSATLTQRQAGWMTIAAVLAGAFGVLVDYFVVGVVILPNVPQGNLVVVWVLAGLLVLVYSYFFIRQFPSFPLRIKILTAFLLVSMLPLAILAWMNVEQTQRTLESQAVQTLTGNSGQAAALLDVFISQQRDNVTTQAANPLLIRYLSLPEGSRAGSPEEQDVNQLLLSLANQNPEYISSYAVLNARGIDVADTYAQDVDLDKSSNDYFQSPITSGLPYITSVRYSATVKDGKRYIYFSSPVRDENGNNLGVLRVRYRADIFQDLMTRLISQSDPNAYLVLVDDRFIRIAHTSDPSLIGKTYAPLTQAQVDFLVSKEMLAPGTTAAQASTNQPDIVTGLQRIGDSGTFVASAAAAGGSDALVAAYRLNNIPWQVLTRKTEAAIQAPITAQRRGSVALALLALAAVAGAAALLTQVLIAPITRLTEVAGEVTAGNLNARARVETNDEIGELAASFNSMTGNLQTTLQGLEARVAERTRAIELSSDVSRRLSTILDPGQLVTEVVDLLQFVFGYYHVQIYLFDETGENLRLVGGTGEAGKTLLERGHFIPRSRGLVGRCCETGVPVVVSDTTADPGWLPNPLLPDTRSEAAVPIIYSDQVLGALDVQNNLVNGLTAQDADLLQGIANQVAIALRNARQYLQAQEQAEREARTSEMIRLIQGTQTVEDALQVAIRELGRALNASGARIRLEPAMDAAPARLAATDPAQGGNGAASQDQPGVSHEHE